MQKTFFRKWITKLLVFAFVLQSVSPSLQGITAYAAEDEEVGVFESEDSLYEDVEDEDFLSEDEIIDVEADQLARDEEDESYKVDDSDKLIGTENSSWEEETDDEWSFQWLFGSKPYSNTFSYTINNRDYSGSLYDAVKKSASEKRPIFLKGDVEVYRSIEIPKGETIEIYLMGNGIKADTSRLGSNAIFKVGNNATLRIYGNSYPHEGWLQNSIRGGGDGAIIAGSESTIVLHNVLFEYNSAGKNGGALYLDGKVSCTLSSVVFNKNEAGSGGGALYVNGNYCNVHFDANTQFTNNKAKGHGGAIYVDGEKVNLYGPAAGKVKLSNNHADGNGGALYGNKKNLSVTSFEFTKNSASNHGGAVYFDSESDGLTNCVLTGNSSTKDGGAVYINGTADSISDTEIKMNTCGVRYQGGGVYVDSRYNFGTSGKIIITNNHFGDGDSAYNDLFLQEGVKTTAYVKAASYGPGSIIGIGVSSWKEGRRLTYSPGNFNPKLFYANYGIYKAPGDVYYVALNNERHLVLTKSKDMALEAVDTPLDRSVWKTKTETVKGKKYINAKGEEYNIVYGYISSPSHTSEDKDIVNKYFYSDGYFMEDPNVYNNHLATLGMNFAMASADSNIGGHDDYLYKFDNIKSAMMGIGCAEDDIYISPSYIFKPTTSSIGVAIGQKPLKKGNGDNTGYILVPIAIRSYGYEKEWASNMTINGNNTSAGHETSGFRDAATQAMAAVDDYIAKFGLSEAAKQGKLKFWLTGFSRGSATANLVSKRLVDKYGSLSKDHKDHPNEVFGYCFAVPAGGTDADDLSIQEGDGSAYYCIHNIINKVDLTPMVAPKEMGFKRYGVDHYVPGGSSGKVVKNQDKASEKNGSYPITTFYDNTAYFTNTTAYKTIRGSMVKQLMYVNDEVYFVDYFKEADINLGKAKAAGQFIKGLFTESQYVSIDEVSDSTLILEDWLPYFYKKVQEYDTLGVNVKLTRDNYSSVVVKGGEDKKKYAAGEIRWLDKGTTAQDTFRGLVEMMLSKTPTEKANLGAAFSGVKNKMGTWQMYRLYENLINNKEGWDADDKGAIQQKYLDLFWGWLSDGSYGQKSINTAITDPAERAQFQNYFPSLLGIVMRVARADFMERSSMRLLGTFAYNSEAILQGHVPEIALAWLRVNDDYYAGENGAYVWKQQTKPTNISISAAYNGKVQEENTDYVYESDVCMKLSANAEGATGTAIYYTLETNGKQSTTQLYNNRQGIKLPAPDNVGSNNYTVRVWTKSSYASSTGKTEWIRYPGGNDVKIYKVECENPPAVVHLYYKVYNPATSEYGQRQFVKLMHYQKGDKVILDTNKLLNAELLKTNAVIGCEWDNEEINTEFQSVYVRDNIQKVCYATFYLSPKINKISIKKSYLDSIKPVAGENLVRTIEGNETSGALVLMSDTAEVRKDFSTKISWLDAEGKPVFDTKAEAGKSYKAVFTVTLNGKKLKFADSVEGICFDTTPGTGTKITVESGNNALSRSFKYEFDKPGTSESSLLENEEKETEEIIELEKSAEIEETGELEEAVILEDAVELEETAELEEGVEPEEEVELEETPGFEEALQDEEITFEDEEFTADKSITVKVVNVNDNSTLLTVDLGTAEAGEKVYVDYDQLVEKLEADGKSTIDFDLAYWKLNDTKVTDESIDPYLLEFIMPNGKAAVTAYVAPYVDNIALRLYQPETGVALMDEPDSLTIVIGDKEYEIDTESVDMEYLDGGTVIEDIAKADTEYTALVTIKTADLKYIEEGASESKNLGLKFFADEDDDELLNVLGFSDEEGKDEQVSFWVNRDDDGLAESICIIATYEETAPSYFIDVEVYEDLVIKWSDQDKNNRYAAISLPDTVEVAVADNSIDSLPAIWSNKFTDAYGNELSSSDLNGTDDWSLIFYGKVKIPEGMSYDVFDINEEEGYKTVVSKGTDSDVVEFEYIVALEGAPFTANPAITPTSGIFDPDEGEIFVEIDPGVYVFDEEESETELTTETEESTDDDVEIYYLITPLEMEKSESEDAFLDEYPVQKYTQAGFDDSGKVVFISTDGYDEAVRYSGDDDDFEDRIIDVDDERFKSGAAVYAVAVKGGSRLSSLSSEYYIFKESEVEAGLEGWTLPVGGKLSDLTSDLPKGCAWHPDVDPEAVVTGNVGDIYKVKVVYTSEDNETSIYEVDIELVTGAYAIYVEGGKVYAYDEDTETETELKELKAEAGSYLVFAADAPKEGEEFDHWIITGDTDAEILTDVDPEDAKRIGVEMPEGALFAKAIYKKDTPAAAVDTLSFGDDNKISLKVDATKTLRAIPYSGEKEIAEKVSYVTTDTNYIEITEDTEANSITVKAKAAGRAVVWAYCGEKVARCNITITRENVFADVYNGNIYDIAGNVIRDSSLPYGTTVVFKANAPRNEATVFEKWVVLEGKVPENQLTNSEITIKLVEDTVLEAVYTVNPGFEDNSELARKNEKIKVKSLKVTDSNNAKISKAQTKVDGRITINAEAVYSTSEKPDILILTSNSDVVKVKTEKTGEGKATGTIIGNLPGIATVTVACGNKKSNITVTVEGEEIQNVAVISERVVELDNKETIGYELTLNAGEQELIEILPFEAMPSDELSVTWKSDNSKIATVKNGLVTAKFNNGIAIITATPQIKHIGTKSWKKLDPVNISVSVVNAEVPKKSTADKAYSISLKSSQKLDINAATLKKKNMVASANVVAKINKYDAAKDKTFTWKSTNENIVTVTGASELSKNGKSAATISADIKATGIGTAYVVLEGKDPSDETKVNTAVMKVVVKATAPDLSFDFAAIGDIKFSEDGKAQLTMKKGSCDRLYYTVDSDVENYRYNTTEKISLSGSGGVSVKNGLIVANKVTKPGKPAKVTLKCGKSKIVLEVIVQ